MYLAVLMGEKILLFVCTIFLSASVLQAQSFSFSPMENIPLSKNGNFLKNPFCGSWNSGQFWPCDMDNDGQNDLLVFDKASGRTLVFLASNISGNLQWKYARAFEDLLPPIQSWMATADYNRDGKLDIFTRAPAGIKVYKNTSELPGQAAFVLENSGLMSEGFNGQVNIQVNAYGAPAFTDIDGDGDLDILNFDFSGNTVEYHRNRIKDNTGSFNGFNFKKDSCVFGRFATKPTCGQFKLNTSCAGLKPPTGGGPDDDKNIQHIGSQLSAIDLDNDGDKDLLVGDIACPILSKLTNGGSPQQALITQSDTLFPSPDDFVRIRDFPSAYRLDADFDGDTDLIVSPTYFNNYSDGFVHNTRQASHLYNNFAPQGAPVFQFLQRDFLQQDAIDAGEESIPAFADADGDGDQDLFLGHLGNSSPDGFRASVHFYKNTGSAENPSFELVTEDYLGLSSLNLIRIRPVFEDFNQDGKTDFGWIASKGSGPTDSTIFNFLLNQAQTGQGIVLPGLASRIRFPFQFNTYDAPVFTDTDGDGLKDMLLAKFNGRLQLWKKNAAWPNQSYSLTNSNYGNIARAPFSSGPAISLADANQDGQMDLLAGDNSGALKFYSGILLQNPTSFTADSTFLYNSLFGLEIPGYWGSFVSPSMADLNGDGFPEMAIGTAGGGINLLVNRFGPNSTDKKIRQTNTLFAYPNPVAAGEFISLGRNSGRYKIWNAVGKLIQEGESGTEGKILLSKDIQPGLYQAFIEKNTEKHFYRIQIWK